jgi:peptide/nickel transport system ATP-binding protein
LTYLLISHDLTLVGQVADSIAVMHHGKIVERGSRQQVLGNPQHAHTRELMGAVRTLEASFRTAQAGSGR